MEYINDLRALMTVVSLLTFIGIIVWAFSRRNRDRFEEAANLPFAEEDVPDSAKTAHQR